jgi:polyisoprenyl-teichoic acid--peptidoglycan teichoic acid transferase
MTPSRRGVAPPPPPPPATAGRSRRRVRRVLVGFLIAANVIVFGALGVVWFAARQITSSVSTIQANSLNLTSEPSISQPRTFLLIGSDSRANVGGLSGDFGNFAGERADVAILLQVHPGENRLQMLSLPRDLKVQWDGSTEKLNATFAIGGAAGIIEAVQARTGIPVHHYIQVDFAGFAGIVDAVGGVRMTFPFPARDIKSGFAVEAGTRLLGGEQALALARSRTYQELRAGGWILIDGGDIGRTARQQDLLLALVTQIDRPSTVAGYGELLDALGEFVIIDNALDADDIIQIAWEMRSVAVEDLDSVTLPVFISNEGGVSYVVEQQPEANAVIDAFRAGEPLAAVSGAIRIEVENGNGRSGAAAAMLDTLVGLGYDVVSTVNSARSDYQVTLVVARPTLLDDANDLVGRLGYGQATAGRTPEGADLVVIVGADAPTP